MIEAQQQTVGLGRDSRYFGLTKIYWQDVRSQVMAVNPGVAACIEQISPGADLYFYKAQHPFGFNIVEHGYYQLCDPAGNSISILDPQVPDELRDDLSFNLHSNPLSLILSGSTELYLEMRNQIVPFSLTKQGALISAWRASNPETSQHPPFLWNISAGARSLFTLPSISENVSHRRLAKAMGLRNSKPTGLMDQWSWFKDMAHTEVLSSPWSCEMLIFPKRWSERIVSDAAFRPLYDYILRQNWVGSEHMRHVFLWDCMFSLIIEQNNLYAAPPIVDTVKHLFSIAVGSRPGFTPAVDDLAGPVAAIQKAYVEHYRLDYAPIMMCPGFFVADDAKPIYYSFNYPTTPFLSQKKSSKSNTIQDLNETERLLKIMRKEILSGSYRMDNIALYDAAQNVQFDFLHANQRAAANMCSSVLPELDNRFAPDAYNGLAFPANSCFWQGAACLSKSSG